MNKNTTRRIVGVLLLIVVFHFIFTNFDVLNHLVGFVVEVEEEPETRNFGITKQIVTEPLKIRENFFKEDFKRFLFLINISNIDNVEGKVTATLICNRSDFFSVNETASIKPGKDHVFNFSTIIYRCGNARYEYQAHDVKREISG
jgi:hypothetical protein